MMSGLMGTVVQGVAWGTGTAVARHAVDSMLGGGSRGGDAPAEAAPAAAPQAYNNGGASAAGPCNEQVKAFADCMSRANGDMGACSYYFENMQSCKLNLGLQR
jgi:membrane protein involved in colicin uptake